MTLPIPQLDDLAWSELVGESRDLLPSTAPSWTETNWTGPSDACRSTTERSSSCVT